MELNKTSLLSDANLNSYWRFEGNSTDETANNNDGTDTAITYSTANGKFGQGAGFNGSTSKIVLADAASLKPTTFAVSAWFKTTMSGTLGTILSTYKNDETGWAVQITGSSVMRIYFRSSFVVSSSVTVNDGKWHHVVVNYNGTARIYIDGVDTGNGTNTFTYGTTPPIRIGSLNAGSETQFFNGSIDDLALFSRVLTTDEITKLYKAGNTGAFFNFF